jgi:protein-S-isoprenylcysteine O-methyltransferase Ste14
VDDGGVCGAMVDEPRPAPGQEKPFAFRAVVYTIGFLVFILGVVPSIFHLVGLRLAGPLDWSAEIRSYWITFRVLVGVAVFAGGFVAYCFSSAWLIGLGRGPHVEFDPPKVFVASGPYRWVRNPVALSLLVTAAGMAIYLASAGIAVLVVVGAYFAHYQVTRIEEPRLRLRFGETYDDYCKQVPRWLPRRPPPDRAA